MIKRRYIGALFLGISGTFDNVDISTLIDELREMNIPEVFIRAIERLLVERMRHLEINWGKIKTATTNKGLLQGRILSLLLFKI